MTTVSDMTKLSNDTVLRLATEARRLAFEQCNSEAANTWGYLSIEAQQDSINIQFAAIIQAEREKASTVFGWLIEHAVDGHCLWLTASGEFVNDSNIGLQIGRAHV